MNQDQMTLPERLVSTARIHGAYLLKEDGTLVLYRGDRLPESLKAALSDHKSEVIRLIGPVKSEE